jgi:hypothetical protein
MRTHPFYPRVRQMITAPEVPRLASGGLALCHLCQRAVYFAGGFLDLLVSDVCREASNIFAKNNSTRMGNNDEGSANAQD